MNNSNYTTSDKCLLCDGNLKLVINLGKTPLANTLLETPTPPELFPLSLMQCQECQHLQIDTIVPRPTLFKNYLYVSNTNQSNINHFKEYANELMKRYQPKFVVDIGSNDGLFLSCFNCKVQGVDPAKNIVKIANANGIYTICNYFNLITAESIKNSDGKPQIITCNNCFAHNADLKPILCGVKELLDDDGVFVLEVPYAMRMLEKKRFDLIYHEHIHHWTLIAMYKFLNQFDLQIIDVKEIDVHGGSIRVFIKRKIPNQFINNKNISNLIEQERKKLLFLSEQFKKNISMIKSDLINKLNKFKTVSILGYPAKAATVCAYLGLDKNMIVDVFDDNTLKIGKYSHLGIQILNTNEINNKNPEALLILSWNYADQLKAKHSNYQGEFIQL